MRRFWLFLGSKKTAVYLLFAFTLTLALSTFLPSRITVSEKDWSRMEAESPAVFWFSEHFSTPQVVMHPVFVGVSVFLFLSTLTCTVVRVRVWLRLRKVEFEKDAAVSFRREVWCAGPPEDVRTDLLMRLRARRWGAEVSEDGPTVSAEKGLALGFWGSVVFHLGMVMCFFSAPVTALTVHRAEVRLTEGVPTRYADAVVEVEGGRATSIDDAILRLDDFWGKWHEGVYRVDFGGTLDIGGRATAFSVNRPVMHGGYSFEPRSFGYSPHLIIAGEKGEVFDYNLNLFRAKTGDSFPFEPGGGGEALRMFVLFFPDFDREGGRLVSRSEEPRNPVLLVKFHRGQEALHKGLLLAPGEEGEFQGYKVRFAALDRWIGMTVVREHGVYFIWAGLLLGVPALFVRFLSNERRLEFELLPQSGGTMVRLSGFSRYYPAFLEKEVIETADALLAGYRAK